MTTTEFEIEDFGQTYHDAVNEFKAMWPNYRNVARELSEPINKMIDIVFEVHPDWSVRRVINTIAADLGDLKGFSVRHLYRFLDDKNRAKIHKKLLEKQQLLRDELYAVKGQMKHYKKFFERGEVILEPDVLKEIGILLKSSPDQIIITHERMHAVGARTSRKVQH